MNAQRVISYSGACSPNYFLASYATEDTWLYHAAMPLRVEASTDVSSVVLKPIVYLGASPGSGTGLSLFLNFGYPPKLYVVP